MLTRRRAKEQKIFKEVYKDFAENTSIHGLKFTVAEEVNVYEKCFWLTIVVCGILGSAYMTTLFWTRYQSNPTRTSVSTNLAPTVQFPFPAVTFCNINRIMASKVDNLIKKLDLFGENVDLIRRAIFQLIVYTNPGWIEEYNMTELSILQGVLENNDIYDQYLLARKLSQTCQEMLVKCRWEDELVDCNKLFKESYTLDGLCCSFNYNFRNNEPSMHTFYSEFNKGLTVLLDAMVQPERNSIFRSVGMIVYIHESTEYPGAGTIKKIVALGRETLLGVSAVKFACGKEIRSLQIEQRKCVFMEEHKLKYFASYSDTNCQLECIVEYLMKICGCVPYYYDFADKPICNISKIPCLDHFIEDSINCDCHPDCEDLSYDVVSTSTAFVRGDYETSSFLSSTTNVSPETHVYVNIYFTQPTQTILNRDTITSTLYLFASFGGVYSLFMGCSFITCVELIYYATLRLYIKMKFAKREPAARKIHPEEAGNTGRISAKSKNKTNISVIYGNDRFIN